eukprot:3564865-Prymnesium_polylepis.1
MAFNLAGAVEGLSYFGRGFSFSVTAGLEKEQFGRAGLPIGQAPSTAWAPAIRAGAIICYAVSVSGGLASCLLAGRQPKDATAVARGHRGSLGAPAMGHLHVADVDARTLARPPQCRMSPNILQGSWAPPVACVPRIACDARRAGV